MSKNLHFSKAAGQFLLCLWTIQWPFLYCPKVNPLDLRSIVLGHSATRQHLLLISLQVLGFAAINSQSSMGGCVSKFQISSFNSPFCHDVLEPVLPRSRRIVPWQKGLPHRVRCIREEGEDL